MLYQTFIVYVPPQKKNAPDAARNNARPLPHRNRLLFHPVYQENRLPEMEPFATLPAHQHHKLFLANS
jgi:hypothetical protein